MKTRFNTYDIICGVTEIQKLIGMRVNNIYDVDNKTYLIRLQRSEEKSVLLLESGVRFHTTGYEWPKNVAPSGFSMKLRKHLKNKRLECVKQLGSDRIVDFQFGGGDAAYHVVLELYDRGNVILTDFERTILYVLRPHTEGDKVKFAVREKYPQDRARESRIPTVDEVRGFLSDGKNGDPIKKILVPKFEYGPSLIEHVLLKNGFSNSCKLGKDFNVENDVEKLYQAVEEAEQIFTEAKSGVFKGYIIQKKEERPSAENDAEHPEYFLSNQEFHPMLYAQHAGQPHIEFESFNRAADEFFSTLQGQKIDMRAIQQEREAVKKLDNVKNDHRKRLEALLQTQENDKVKAELITKNQELVDGAILAVQSALANQISWTDIEDLVKDATAKGDPIAKQIKQLHLDKNHISLLLTDPYPEENCKPTTLVIDVDLGLTAFANARRYYDQKRSAAKKQQKTIESQTKALKSAEKKTKQVLKEMKTTTNINKARKVYWFEKFFWFVSSENYLVIGGRDQQQNELIVKRYMKPKDVYVHADVHGASSIVIKNPTGAPVPPKTLNEAGTMAICYSVAWEAKVLTNAYWVFGEQVSKTAPTGEYLTTGSFMVRGKKNFLPPSHLVFGLGFMFRLEDGSVERHKGERKVLVAQDADEKSEDEAKDEEVVISDDSDQDDDEGNSEGKDKPKEDNQKDDDDESEVEKDEEESKLDDIREEEEDSSDEEEEKSAFPDTHIKIKHFEGTRVNILTESSSALKELNQVEKEENKPGHKQPYCGRSRTNSENSVKTQNSELREDKKQQQAKRGQKSKLKKIKEKYKDQDEEERNLRMTILQSAGPTTKKGKKNKEAQQQGAKGQRTHKPQQPGQPRQTTDLDDEPVVQADVDMIDSLTGLPVTEDELLFAVPVVAPYNTLSQYKYKVKLTPGTSKRGKAAKTAVSMFLHDRAATAREKDLLKAVKDEILARNIPGKVKLSAPRLQVHRK